MTKARQRQRAPRTRVNASRYRVRLPGFITDEEIGLGDVIKRATSYLGIKPCGGCEGSARRTQPLDDVRQQARRQGNRASSALKLESMRCDNGGNT